MRSENNPGDECPNKADFVIIGAGFAGVCTLLRLIDLASAGQSIVLLERGEDLFPQSSTSANQCGKLHLGLHYAGSPETAIKCLRDSIQLAKMFPDCLIDSNDPNSPSRRGRHYVMSGSVFSGAEVRAVADKLREEYAHLIREDPPDEKDPIKNPGNQVFGELDNFIVEIAEDDYKINQQNPIPSQIISRLIYQPDKPLINDRNEEQIPDPSEEYVALAFETAESQIDLNKLRRRVFQKIKDARKAGIDVRFIPNCQVLKHQVDNYFQGAHTPYGFKVGYTVDVLRSDEGSRLSAYVVVDCTWVGSSLLRGSENLASNQICRAKVSILVDLPDSIRDINTCIFSIGPYCSITNQRNGKAIVTYEPATNIGEYRVGQDRTLLPGRLGDYFRGDDAQKQLIFQAVAEEIKSGAALYVPELANAVISEPNRTEIEAGARPGIGIGFVLQDVRKGQLNSIYGGRDSAHHARLERGLLMPNLGLIKLFGMKMTYCGVLGALAANKAGDDYLRLRGEWRRMWLYFSMEISVFISGWVILYYKNPLEVIKPIRQLYKQDEVSGAASLLILLRFYPLLNMCINRGHLLEAVCIAAVCLPMTISILTDEDVHTNSANESRLMCGLEPSWPVFSRVIEGLEVGVFMRCLYDFSMRAFSNSSRLITSSIFTWDLKMIMLDGGMMYFFSLLNTKKLRDGLRVVISLNGLIGEVSRIAVLILINEVTLCHAFARNHFFGEAIKQSAFILPAFAAYAGIGSLTNFDDQPYKLAPPFAVKNGPDKLYPIPKGLILFRVVMELHKTASSGFARRPLLIYLLTTGNNLLWYSFFSNRVVDSLYWQYRAGVVISPILLIPLVTLWVPWLSLSFYKIEKNLKQSHFLEALMWFAILWGITWYLSNCYDSIIAREDLKVDFRNQAPIVSSNVFSIESQVRQAQNEPIIEVIDQDDEFAEPFIEVIDQNNEFTEPFCSL